MKHSTSGTVLALCTFALLSLGSTARAQLVSSLSTSPNTAFSGTTTLAAQFTLTSPVTVTSATLFLTAPSSSSSANLSNLTAAFFTDSGSNSLGSSIAASTGATGTLSNATSAITFTFNSAELASGTYWLELSNGGSGSILWASNLSSVTNTGTSGTVNQLSYNNFSGVIGQGALYSIDGSEGISASPTPEPGVSALLVGLTFTGMGLLSRRRRRR